MVPPHHQAQLRVFKAPDFIAAALLHLPPKGQQTVRYYGLDMHNPGRRLETGGSRSGAMRNHSKLKAFGLADRLACSVYEKTSSFLNEEMFGLTSQLRRASVSIAWNIMEDCARHSKPTKKPLP
jgi:hypothetical protein